MYRTARGLLFLALIVTTWGLSACGGSSQPGSQRVAEPGDRPDWQIGPFEKYEGNPILTPGTRDWESKDVFNPATWADRDSVYMLYRAEDSTGMGEWNGTSRIGLATSADGFQFERRPEPVFGPSEPWELPGGTEDPRLVRVRDTFYLTYTGYDGETARLGIASSTNLTDWTKHGQVFPDSGWTKAGAILPQKVDGRYWMYFGDTNIWAAHSKNLVEWTAIPEPVLEPREGRWDGRLVEPGPAPRMTEHGILLLYNAANDSLVYRTGQALFDPEDPTRLVERSEEPFLTPTAELSRTGQVPNVVFIEGLVRKDGQWFLYFGMGDSGIGVATAPVEE